jgi:hypothetical protein
MGDFPIMANNNMTEAPRSRLQRKPVGRSQGQEQHQAAALPYMQAQAAIPRPPYSADDGGGGKSFYHHQDDAGHTLNAPQPQPNIHPNLSIPVPHTAATPDPNTRPRHSFFGLANRPSPGTTPNTSSSSSSSKKTEKPHVDVPAAEVRRCTKLLRRMYELQLDMWSMKFTFEEDMPERLEKKRQADALLVEIQNMVATWMSTTGAQWTPEERRQVDYIGKYLDSLSQNKFW